MARLFELVCRHTIQIEEWEDKLAAVKKVVKKEVESNAAMIKSLWKRVNLLHKEIKLIGAAFQRALYL